jgi:hypothetical protein
VLRLQLDKQGVRSFDTRVAKIDTMGIPRIDRDVASPCWNRGQGGVRPCRSSD